VSPGPLVHIVMLGWIPVLMALFAVLRGHVAIAGGFVAAWLFLPMYGYRIMGMPDYTKISATTVGVFLAALVFDSGRLASFRPRWFDMPMLLWCVLPMATSLDNGLGPRDGLSDMVSQTITWGLPYLLGRVYFSNMPAQRHLAIAILIGGILYIPLCLFEIRMSPQLHHMFYGYHQHDFKQTVRFGGWRPTVFLQHGLAVGMFMATATLVGVWLWVSGSVRRLWGVPMVLLVAGLFVTAVLCKSALALLLLMGGLGALAGVLVLRTRLGIVVLLALPLMYIGARTAGGWSGEELLQLGRLAGEDRAESLETRIVSETLLWERAAERPILGWGGWGRSRLVDEETGKSLAITDGLWVIFAGKYGVLGLAAFWTAMLVGPLRFLVRTRPGQWKHPMAAGAVVMSVLIAMHMCDNLMNAMINPVLVLGAGGLAGLSLRGRRRVSRPLAEGEQEWSGLLAHGGRDEPAEGRPAIPS
jgi:O-antigen ligase